jgi:UDP-N-acetylglucosamine 2-epimerase (non-hydrolysing)
VIVVGDVNSTLACGLVAVKKRIPVVHVEAGLRSFDREMPEEINRILVDQIAEILYTTERSAADNLLREGVGAERIRFVGNVMIDSLLRTRQLAVRPAETLAKARSSEYLVDGAAAFGVVTLHRPSNVDNAVALHESLSLLREVARRLPLVWPVHPRTRGNIDRFGLAQLLSDRAITLLPPQGYLEMVGLLDGARLVLTDSGGIQEENCVVAGVVLDDGTERPITCRAGHHSPEWLRFLAGAVKSMRETCS